MQTRSLQTLARIAQVGSFAIVADELNTTLSTVSMQMKSLEELLGVHLFDRSYRPPKLTPLGRVVAEHAGRVISAEKELIDVCNPKEELAGSFRIGFIATASVRLLPDFLSQAAKQAPATQFEIETALSETLEERVLSGQLDAAVVTASDQPLRGLRYDILREERLVYAVPSTFAKLPLSELVSTLPFLQFNPNSGIGKLIETKMLSMAGDAQKEIIVLDSVEAIIECVNADIGFTLLSEPDVRRYARESVDVIQADAQGLSRKLALVSVQGELTDSNVQKLLSLF